jgi:phospholipid/cholesterol/gamma-HCH transport system ATP-binding protein
MRLKMGMMFQVSGLFTDMSVYDNLAFPLREHTDLPEEIIKDLVLMKLNAVGLRNARDLMPSELSGGMERRVALARAVTTDPPLVIYDEPFAGLDPISLNTIANLIRTLNNALGTTSIVVTYDLMSSLKVVDYLYFIHDGVVAARGSVEGMLNSQDPLVHQFLHAEPDGPIGFQYACGNYRDDLQLGA